ncbi:hypothetical protein BJV82DRAFT_576354 [Fennellomyces sp. T-0311]|nr:hypothetical protein BJV82DRAFT_576354 [Fennellomyces sp. T-0311]
MSQATSVSVRKNVSPSTSQATRKQLSKATAKTASNQAPKQPSKPVSLIVSKQVSPILSQQATLSTPDQTLGSTSPPKKQQKKKRKSQAKRTIREYTAEDIKKVIKGHYFEGLSPGSAGKLVGMPRSTASKLIKTYKPVMPEPVPRKPVERIRSKILHVNQDILQDLLSNDPSLMQE